MNKCHICKRELDQPGDPTTKDCGGDCVQCMARYGDDPDCRKSMFEITGDPQWADEDEDEDEPCA
jgi:hypothetical protein